MKGRTEVICAAIVLTLLSSCSSHDTEKEQEIQANVEILKELETQDLAKVTQTVSDMQKELAKDADADQGSYWDVFTNAVVMGDSIAAGLEEYNLLSSIQVVAGRGKNLNTIDDEIEKVIQLAPTDIFLSFGMNDLAYCRGITDLFISRYEEVIARIQSGLPHVKLHINAILPIQQNAIDAEPVYAKYTEFNDALKDMCKRLNIPYIDNSSIITAHNISYNPDGIHPMYDFYPYWLSHMAEGL